jgi:hypothetical protein
MADEFVGRFGVTAPDGIPALASKPIVDPHRMPLEIGDQFGDGFSGLGILRVHPLQAPDDACTSSQKSLASAASYHSCCRSGCAPYCRVAIVWGCSQQW